jgi:hypothetical protein
VGLKINFIQQKSPISKSVWIDAKRVTNSVGFKPQLNKVASGGCLDFSKGIFRASSKKIGRAQIRQGAFDSNKSEVEHICLSNALENGQLR